MEYGAIDLHKRYTWIRIVLADGTAVLERRVPTGAVPDQFPDVGRRVRRANRAVVIAVLHQHRRPDAWKARVSPS